MVLSDGDFLLQKTLKQLSPKLHTRFLDTAFVMTRTLDKVVALFPDFTDHAVRHALIVMDFIDRLIGQENIGKLNEDEIYLLLCSTYLHDIGMTINEKNYMEMKAGIVPKEDEEAHPERSIRYYIREYHQEFSAKMICKYADIFEFPSEEYVFCIAQLARGHRKTPIIDAESFPVNYRLPNGNTVCLPYLSALLRLADELDIAIDRNPISAYEEHPDTLAFRQHFAVKHLYMEENGFIMQIETNEQDVLEACLEAGRKLKEVVSYCDHVINDLTPFSLSQKTLKITVNGEETEV